MTVYIKFSFVCNGKTSDSAQIQSEMASAGLLQSILYEYGDTGGSAMVSKASSITNKISSHCKSRKKEVRTARASKARKLVCTKDSGAVETKLAVQDLSISDAKSEQPPSKEEDEMTTIFNPKLVTPNKKTTSELVSIDVQENLYLNEEDFINEPSRTVDDAEEESEVEEEDCSVFQMSLDVVDWAIRQLVDLISLYPKEKEENYSLWIDENFSIEKG